MNLSGEQSFKYIGREFFVNYRKVKIKKRVEERRSFAQWVYEPVLHLLYEYLYQYNVIVR